MLKKNTALSESRHSIKYSFPSEEEETISMTTVFLPAKD